MKILLTGGTGFTGSYVVPLLIEKGYDVRCFVREGSDISKLPSENREIFKGDLGVERDLEESMKGIDIFVNIASLGFGHAPLIIKALKNSGIKRGIFVSTTAIFTNLNSSAKAIRMEAERLIKGSGLNYTIIRPTMIYGDANDRNMSRLVNFIKKRKIVPIFGSGGYLQQPVYVKDAATAIRDAIENENTRNKSYNIAGAKALSYNEVIDEVARLLNKKVIKVHIPARPVVSIMRFFERISMPLPLKGEQIQRLNEDKAFDISRAVNDFGYNPLSFREGMTNQLKSMGYL